MLYNKNQAKYQITKTENSHSKQLELPEGKKQDIQSQELNTLLLRENTHTFPRRTLSFWIELKVQEIVW